MTARFGAKALSAMLVSVTILTLLASCAPASPAQQPIATTAPGQASGNSQPAAATAPTQAAASTGSSEPVELTFWWWAESDAPGADKWLEETITSYKKDHPNVTVKMVPQSTDTLISAFTAAAAAKSGPDLASQWATIPVLSQVWAGAVTPISDLVPADEIKHWANTNENMYNGKLWAAPLYLMGIPLAYNKDLYKKAGLDPEKPPKTWGEFLAACEALKKAGITPMAGGAAKASAFGAWSFAILGVQNLDSVDDIKAAATGDVPFTSEKYTQYLTAIEDMLKKGYFNDNIASLDYPTAMDLFPQEKVAMSWGTDGNVAAWAKTLGADKVGITKTPILGKRKLAEAYDATQSTSFFVTSWSKHPKEAADFLVYMHTPERLNAWYKATGVVPADDRFDVKQITDPFMAKLAEYNLSPVNVWLENYIPTQMDMDGLRPGGSQLTSGSSAAEVADMIDRTLKLWRSQNAKDVETFRSWK